jgi:hypothetical protein
MSDAELALPLPRAIGGSQVRRRLESLFVLGAYAYPAIFVASLYLTWFAAWAALGHSPRPSLDDPKFIGLLVDIPYAATLVLLVGAPGAVLLGLFWTPIAVGRRSAPRRRRLLLGLVALGGLVLLWGAALWFLRADPWAVGTWYMD